MLGMSSEGAQVEDGEGSGEGTEPWDPPSIQDWDINRIPADRDMLSGGH